MSKYRIRTGFSTRINQVVYYPEIRIGYKYFGYWDIFYFPDYCRDGLGPCYMPTLDEAKAAIDYHIKKEKHKKQVELNAENFKSEIIKYP